MHGAGCRSRERAGIRRNPRLGHFTHGLRAGVAASRAFVESRPDLVERARDYTRAGREELRKLDRVLARLWAMADLLSEGPLPRDRVPPMVSVLKAIGVAIERSYRVEFRLAASEQKAACTEPDIET